MSGLGERSEQQDATSDGVICQIESMSYSPIALDSIDRWTWQVTVEYAGHELWAVRNGSRCLSADNEWEYEPIPSSRTDEWLAQHRFPLHEAQRRAMAVCGSVTWNGLSADQIAARERVS